MRVVEFRRQYHHIDVTPFVYTASGEGAEENGPLCVDTIPWKRPEVFLDYVSNWSFSHLRISAVLAMSF